MKINKLWTVASSLAPKVALGGCVVCLMFIFTPLAKLAGFDLPIRIVAIVVMAALSVMFTETLFTSKVLRIWKLKAQISSIRSATSFVVFLTAFLRFLRQPRSSSAITFPPGHRLASCLRFILPTKTFERLVAQIILDERDEHSEALSSGQSWKAGWISIRIWILVFTNLVGAACASAASKLFPRPPSL